MCEGTKKQNLSPLCAPQPIPTLHKRSNLLGPMCCVQGKLGSSNAEKSLGKEVGIEGNLLDASYGRLNIHMQRQPMSEAEMLYSSLPGGSHLWHTAVSSGTLCCNRWSESQLIIIKYLALVGPAFHSNASVKGALSHVENTWGRGSRQAPGWTFLSETSRFWKKLS